MTQLLIENMDGRIVTFESKGKTALQILQENQIDWMHACGAKGRCTTCTMIVTKGIEECSPLTEAELNYRAKGRLPETARLACQVKPLGNVHIRVPQPYKLPHLTYSD